MILHEIRKSKAYSGAVCRKGILCDYRRDFRLSDEMAHVDVCASCGKKQVYRIKDGKINDSRYRRDHLRDILQRGSSLYEQIYGKPDAMKEFKSREKNKREFHENTAEVVRRAMRLENQGRL